MRRKILLSFTLLLVTLATTWPVSAAAQARPRGGGRVIVARGPLASPFYSPFFYDPFFSPWGPWGWGGFGWGPGWGYPYGGFRWTNDASVRIDARPRDAQVYVDGYFAGEVDQYDGKLQRLHLPPGTHEIVIYKEGYKSVRERVYLAPNSSRKLTGDLDRLAAGEPNEPPPQPAQEPTAEPRDPGDDVTAPPPPRDRDFRDPRARRAPGSDPRLDRSRRPARNTGSTGTVAIRVQPGDAAIFIDGERWAGGGADERLIVQLTEGPHRIEVQKDGYRQVTLEVEVRRGETSPVNISLSRD